MVQTNGSTRFSTSRYRAVQVGRHLFRGMQAYSLEWLTQSVWYGREVVWDFRGACRSPLPPCAQPIGRSGDLQYVENFAAFWANNHATFDKITDTSRTISGVLRRSGSNCRKKNLMKAVQCQ